MPLKFCTFAAAVALIAAPAAGQSNSFITDRPAPVAGDPDKLVCKKEEKIGTRLGAKKVCLTVREWTARAAADREQTETVQAGVKVCSETCQTEFGKPF